ncbi:20331_t:CDS:2, partial [Gigaspora margarita]
YFVNECKSLERLKDSKLMIEDVHFYSITVYTKAGLYALQVIAVGEIKKRSSNQFSNADIGQAVSFGEKVTRSNSNNRESTRFSYEYVLPANLKYESNDHPPDGWRYLATIMECNQEELGWVDPSLNFNSDTVKLVRSINTGRTSIVYEGKLNDLDSVIVKLAKNEEYLSCFENEKRVLEKLGNLPHIPKLLLHDENSLITIPLGTKVRNLRRNDIKNVIETLKTAHSQNIIHMDLQGYNFIRDDDEKILIIDWGYSVSGNENGRFAGALECMPDDVLKSLIIGEQITYSPRY